MSNKVYIVTAGSYDDYRIVTVFSTEERAKAFTTSLDKNEQNDSAIECWQIDPKPGTSSYQKYGLISID